MLFMSTDQEGGREEHVAGFGNDTKPSAVEQCKMSADALRPSAGMWGSP